MSTLTVVVYETDQGGAEQSVEEVHTGQAQNGRLKQVVLDPQGDVEDGCVGEDGEDTTDSHHDQEAVEKSRR